MLRRVWNAVRSKAALAAERDAAVLSRDREREAFQQQIRLLREEREFLHEQLEAYRDTLATFQCEQRLRGAIAKTDLMALERQKD